MVSELGQIKPRTDEEMRVVYERRLKTVHDAGIEFSQAEQRLVNKLKIEGYRVNNLEEAKALVAFARRILFSSPSQGIA